MTWDHPTLSEEEFDRRTRDLLEEEAQEPEEWYYLSFALPKEEGGFLGGVYLKARGIMWAVSTASMLGINPGGEVQSWGPIAEELMDARVPKEKRWRLLSKEEV